MPFRSKRYLSPLPPFPHELISSSTQVLCTDIPIPAPDSVVSPARKLALDGPALNGSLEYPVGVQTYRIYVPDTYCGAVRIYAVTISGAIEVCC